MAMADVFVAFVREDQVFAEAIAIALQDAGLAVSRSASVMEAIDASPAVVVLWTPASSRSRLFLDAADRAFRSGKMVLARLGGAPAPAEYQQAMQHDFRSWSGDPDHGELNVIVDHVRRLNAFARGRSSAAGGYPQPPATVHPFPSAPQRPAQPLPPPQAPPGYGGADPRLVEEAAFWRRVQTGGTPADYRAYLDRYGPQGAFAELAALKLNQMTAAPPPRAAQQAPLPPPPMAPARPQAASPMRPPPEAPAQPGGGSMPGRDLHGRDLHGRAPPPSRFEPEGFRPDRVPGHRDQDRVPHIRRDADQASLKPPKSGAGIGALIFLIILGGLAAGAWFVYNGGSFLPPPAKEAPAARTPITERQSIEAPEAEPDAGPRQGDRNQARPSAAASKTEPTPAAPPATRPAASAKASPAPAPAPAKTAPPPKSAPQEPDPNAAELERLRREVEDAQGPPR